MDLNDLKKLKSGTDVRGTAVGDKITLTDEAVARICRAFCVWLKEKKKYTLLNIALGNDPRISSDRIAAVATEAFVSSGANVTLCGLSSTPSMFILLAESDFGCNASVMITASHLPYDRNGLKFFTPEGGLSGNDIDEILNIAAANGKLSGNGTISKRSFMDEYSRILVQKVEHVCGFKPLSGKKIIVDAGNGAGGFFAEKVLVPLGADTNGSLFSEPDGTFPNHIPNPEDKNAIACIAEAVKAEKADLGIIFDTDVDRAACVDKNGKEINRNALIALVAAMVLPEKGGTIVTDSVTSVHLTTFIERLGGKHLRFKRGYRNVIDKCRELNEKGIYSPIAIETSGHAAFAENYYLDDGAYLVTRILICLSEQAKRGNDIGDLIKDLQKPAEECEVRLMFNGKSKNFRSEGEEVINALKLHAEQDKNVELSPDNYEGVRYACDDCRTLVRISVHDPVMPINFESDKEGGIKTAAEKLYGLLRGYDFLDLAPLEKYIEK